MTPRELSETPIRDPSFEVDRNSAGRIGAICGGNTEQVGQSISVMSKSSARTSELRSQRHDFVRSSEFSGCGQHSNRHIT